MTSQQILYTPQRLISANGIDIMTDAFGDREDRPILLINGLGMQMIGWEDEFCANLARQGHYVIRYDNRDIGKSTWFDDAGIPDIQAIVLSRLQGQTPAVPYTLKDMAADGAALLIALGINAAHIVGVSMGGMIAQVMALNFPEAVLTLISIMSSTQEPNLPPAEPHIIAELMAPSPSGREAYIESSVKSSRLFGSPGYPFDEQKSKQKAARNYDRGLHPAGTSRQMAAVFAAAGRRDALGHLTTPALILHGEDDPLVPLTGGIDTAKAIPNSKLHTFPGMGHSIPDELTDEVIALITNHTSKY